MAVFGPNQRQELLIGNALAAETTFSTFQSGASDKELAVLSAGGGAVAANEKFYVLQKTSGNAGLGLDFEFSDKIDPAYVEYVAMKEYAPEVQKLVTVTGFTGTPKANATYEVMIRLYNDGGSLSTENFRHIVGSYVTGSETVTNADVINGIVDSLNASLTLDGGIGLFDVNNVTDTSITIEAKPQSGDPAKNIASQIQFDVQVAVKSNGSDPETGLPESYNILTATTTTTAFPGIGTGKQVQNLEYFCRGYNYEAYRQTGYPADFTQPALYSDYNGAYNVIHISYYKKNSVVGVEEQPRIVSIAVEKIPGNPASNAATNDVLAQLRTAIGSEKVPADLAVV